MLPLQRKSAKCVHISARTFVLNKEELKEYGLNFIGEWN
jgi:hypothetical protein